MPREAASAGVIGMNIVEVINYKCKKVKMYGRLLHFVLMSGKTYHLRTAQISLAASVNITVPHGARKSSTKRKRTNERMRREDVVSSSK